MKTVRRTHSGFGGLLASRREEVIEKQYNEIKKLESKYRKLYEGSPVMCRTINVDGIILDCNQAYLDGLGFAQKAQVIGHSIFEHTPEDSVELKRDSFEQWRQTGIVRDKEVWMKRKDGSKFPALINANNLYDDDGKLASSNTVIIDLTEMHKARTLLEKANDQLKQAQEMKDEFIRIAAHELRTPIQPILLCAELAKRSDNKEEKLLDMLATEARRLKKLSDDILDVSKIEGGRLPYNFEKFGINQIIREAVACVALAAADRAAAGKGLVTVEAKLTDDIELFIDKGRIAQAMGNILGNSLKFTKDGRIDIETAILPHKKLMEIRVHDTGGGIAPEILPRLFEKFATKTSGNVANMHGTGLGLFITKAILQAHGGDIIAYNDQDGGATFVMRLPLEKVNR